MKFVFFLSIVILACLGPIHAFSPTDCAENYIADDLPTDARAQAFPDYFVEPGQLGGDMICTLIPSEVHGRIIQVSEPIGDSPNGAFVQYFPDRLQIFRADGDGAGLSLTHCGPIPSDLPPERLPGGFWCRIDLALGRGVSFVLEYDADGGLGWLNFEISSYTQGVLEGSTLLPMLPETEPDELRAAVFLTEPDTTYLLRYMRSSEVFRMAEPEAIIALYRRLRDAPQAMTLVIETGAPGTGPFAQVDLPEAVIDAIFAELDLAEQLIRTDRSL